MSCLKYAIRTSLAVILGQFAAAHAADIPGAKDPPFLKRYEGSEIVFSMTRVFDQYPLVVPDPGKPGTANAILENREGAITRLYYDVPEDHTALELFRNYQGSLKEAGFDIAYEFQPCKEDWGNGNAHAIFAAVKASHLDADPFVSQGGSYTFAPTLGPYCFFTAKGNINGQDIAVTVEVVEENKLNGFKQVTATNGVHPMELHEGHILVGVDIVASKAIEIKMVEVKASEMADALAAKGTVDLYGILFDVDKSTLRPESGKTLDEVANLLKIDRSLKLEISGHTDNTGDNDHNQKLSEGRAQAVVDVLVRKYGINAARLQSKGYGDTMPVAANDSDTNKAKNRRVELRKL